IPMESPYYRPFHELLTATHQRYGRPILLAETGAEGQRRVPWLRYVCDQVAIALHNDVPIEGICFYPITDYPGWSNSRHCKTGLLGYANEQGQRPVFAPLAEAIALQQGRFGQRPVQEMLHVQ
ncbi:MAG TPA: beta-glucosidase, partial [Halomonas sp.]|nr:beta-glucosidase [Halomonas sp.]